MGLRFRKREKCLGGEKTQICRERLKKMKSKIELDLYIENASRWIEDLLSTNS